MLVDLTVTDFVEELKSGKPTPGGGGVAALNAALGAGLIMMVANHTIGHEKYAEWEEDCIRIRDEADALRAKFLEGVDNDAAAFGRVAAAFRMPKETDEEKGARSEEIEAASVEAAEAPLSVMADSVEALKLCKEMLGRSNPNLESDLHVAALSLGGGIASAKYNVEANLPALRKKNPELAEELETRCNELTEEGRLLATVITGYSKLQILANQCK